MNIFSIRNKSVDKGKTEPRVTPEDLEDCIVSCYFFTAANGICDEERENGRPEAVLEESLNLLTFCVLVLRNGFTVTGESACVSSENFDADIGKQIARENAKQKLWPLLGYNLRQELYEGTR